MRRVPANRGHREPQGGDHGALQAPERGRRHQLQEDFGLLEPPRDRLEEEGPAVITTYPSLSVMISVSNISLYLSLYIHKTIYIYIYMYTHDTLYAIMWYTIISHTRLYIELYYVIVFILY